MKKKFINKLLILISVLLLVFACVPTKKVVYLQSKKISADSLITEEIFKTPAYEFRFKEGDVLSINVFSITPSEFNFFNGSPQLKDNTQENQSNNSNSFTIDESGHVTLPVAGKVKLLDLTIEQGQEKIKNELYEFLQDPIVTINLLNFNYTILGEVNLPGRYNSINPRFNILEALATAGDMTDFAERSRIKLIRADSKGNTKVIYFNALENSLLTKDIYFIKPNDIIIVDPLKAKSFRQNQLFALSTFFGIIGAVGIVIIQLIN